MHLTLWMLAACSLAPTAPGLEPLPQAPATTHGIAYETFGAAVDHADVGGARALAHTPDEVRYVDALEQVFRGDMEAARRGFEGLADSPDEALRARAANDRAQVLFHAAEWQALAALGGDQEEVVVAEAFATLPPERIHLPEGGLTVDTPLTSFGTPTVTVEINGQPRVFWIDTGAFLTVLASDVADELGVAPLPARAVDIGTATTNRVDIQPAIIEELRVGSLSIENHRAVILNGEDLEVRVLGVTIVDVDGILGWNFIQRFRMEMDYANGRTWLGPSGPPAPDRNLVWLGEPFVVVGTPEVSSLPFFLDTGATKTSITKELVEHLGPIEATESTSRVGGAGGVESVSTLELGAFTLHVGGAAMHFDEMTAMPAPADHEVAVYGVLGSDLAQGRVMVIDAGAGTFEVREATDGSP